MQDFCQNNKDLFIVAVKMPDWRYHTSATHAAEQSCQRTLSGAVPLNRYEKSDNVNLRYQNTATGGTKSPILSTNLMFVIYKYILVACLRLFCRGTNMEHVLDRNR